MPIVVENNSGLFQFQIFKAGELAGFVQYDMDGADMRILHTSMKRSFKSALLTETTDRALASFEENRGKIAELLGDCSSSVSGSWYKSGRAGDARRATGRSDSTQHACIYPAARRLLASLLAVWQHPDPPRTRPPSMTV